MKIVHIYDGHERVLPGEGSVPSVVYELAKHTAKKGHDVTIIERRWQGTKYREEVDGIRFDRFNLNLCSNVSNMEVIYEQIKRPEGILRLIVDRAFFAIRANKYLGMDDFDVLHVHLPFAANILINLDRKLRMKTVYTAHVGEEKKRFKFDTEKENSLLLRFFSPDLYLMERIKKNVVLNEPLRKKLIEKGIEEQKIVTIANGIETGDFGDYTGCDIRNKYQIEGKSIVLFAGSITPRKGVYYLIKAAEMLKQYENVLFLLVGNTNVDKEFANRIMKHVKNCHLNNVRFTGLVPYEDLKALYSVCDLFVLPSLEEGDAIALKEALASGKPLIGTMVGGIPFQIRNGWNGFLVKAADEKQLQNKINYLIHNPEKSEEMGRNSRKLAEKFDWNKIVERYLEVYEEVKG